MKRESHFTSFDTFREAHEFAKKLKKENNVLKVLTRRDTTTSCFNVYYDKQSKKNTKQLRSNKERSWTKDDLEKGLEYIAKRRRQKSYFKKKNLSTNTIPQYESKPSWRNSSTDKATKSSRIKNDSGKLNTNKFGFKDYSYKRPFGKHRSRYIEEPLGTRDEWNSMSTKQSYTNRKNKF